MRQRKGTKRFIGEDVLGTPLKYKYCTKCGKLLHLEAMKCPKCSSRQDLDYVKERMVRTRQQLEGKYYDPEQLRVLRRLTA